MLKDTASMLGRRCFRGRWISFGASVFSTFSAVLYTATVQPTSMSTPLTPQTQQRPDSQKRHCRRCGHVKVTQFAHSATAAVVATLLIATTTTTASIRDGDIDWHISCIRNGDSPISNTTSHYHTGIITVPRGLRSKAPFTLESHQGTTAPPHQGARQQCTHY